MKFVKVNSLHAEYFAAFLTSADFFSKSLFEKFFQE